MLTPLLTRDMLIRRNWPPFLLGTNFENHGRDETHGKGADGGVAFPCYGCWPPSSCGGPYLDYGDGGLSRETGYCYLG